MRANSITNRPIHIRLRKFYAHDACLTLASLVTFSSQNNKRLITMAKTTTAKTATATKAPAKTTRAKATPSFDIEKASEEALKKLQELGIDQQLQSDLEWCLGSYRHDKNPSGLYEAVGRAVTVFNAEKTKKTKGITVKLIDDLEKALKVQ